MKLVVGTFLSMDGVMQAPGGPEEDTDGGFAHGGWTFPYFDEALGSAVDSWLQTVDALLLGRRTYEIFAAHWPRVDDTDPASPGFNRLPKYVVTRTLQHLDWEGSTILGEDTVGEVQRLKARPGRDLLVQGSSRLVPLLAAHDLVDEYRLMVFPVLLGTGKRLFDALEKPQRFEVADSFTSEAGVHVQTYRRAGDVQTGSFALEES
jgi:dihydrofolate reductase